MTPMAGPFSIAEKRGKEMTSNRTVSLDISPKTAPNTANNTPVHHSSDAISTAAVVTMMNSGRIASKSSSPKNYFRPAHSEITYGKMRFLITHMPNDKHLDSYILDLERKQVVALVRVCETNYSDELLKANGIKLYDWVFEDGGSPNKDIIEKFLQLCIDTFATATNNECIGIHCVLGLGRSPVLIALALLEAGMKTEDAVFLIRSQRRGALNDKQLEFLNKYKPTGRLSKLRYTSTKQRKSCAIM